MISMAPMEPMEMWTLFRKYVIELLGYPEEGLPSGLFSLFVLARGTGFLLPWVPDPADRRGIRWLRSRWSCAWCSTSPKGG
jgi:hypothetical protein